VLLVANQPGQQQSRNLSIGSSLFILFGLFFVEKKLNAFNSLAKGLFWALLTKVPDCLARTRVIGLE